ncbi:MAG: DEAD/DEAH box helicase, partial [Deltaproteobacteria bacterium]|nr:DEAD/DEAH box helicase [Deltaproteobacteria bacterium]
MNVLNAFHEPVRSWFESSFQAPTRAQTLGWTPIVQGTNTLLLAPTGSGKTLAAFLSALDRLLFTEPPPQDRRCRVLYVSPLKALAVDVERNLRAPLAGIALTAERMGVKVHVPEVGIRTGDTPQKDRARMVRAMPDILITTPESLFLMLTSRAREGLKSVDTVIVDEIHALVGTKRGAHLFLSLERLEALRKGKKPLQRIGLSATQRPLDEIARALGGGVPGEHGWTPRPVEIVDAGTKRQIELRVEVPVDDMSRMGEQEDLPSEQGGNPRSIWPAIYPRLVELIRENRSTIIFCNARRLAERIAAALNELAQEELALAHHGSVAREQRQQMEDELKRGKLRCIVATSTLELGIDMGAVDLVVQIEAPPSVSSGLQRLGRAKHQVGGVPRGVMFPKHRSDLLAAAAAAQGMTFGEVEVTLYPRNPLDVLAQQLVAACVDGPVDVDALFKLSRSAAPFADLPRSSFEGVLDLLAGRYPSDEFAELRPRLVWDRVGHTVRAKDGAARIAIANAGTIPDRGLFGVFLAGDGSSRRVGELDEEMVFESRVGDVFVLGASSWRIEEITHDRVNVSPAPGVPGKMPFWKGDNLGRPLEFGERVGKLSRELVRAKPEAAQKRLMKEHGLDERAAKNLLAYLHEQQQATGEVPSDQALVIERCVDEIGDFRVCVLTPFGARVHAPWATAVVGRLRDEHGLTVEHLWTNEGMVFRFPESETPPQTEWFLPTPEEIEDLVVRSLGQSALFAARFRENAGRALLLPRRRPGQRSPLWHTRKRAADLLSVAQRYPSFPILLETYRECLRDVFDLPGLVDILKRVADRRLRVVTVDSTKPSPFAASLLFSYVANFIYDGDAPLAERRAQALSVDQAQLRELLGEAELRELLDPQAIFDFEQQAQRLDARHPPKSADGLHDLLLTLGDLSQSELEARVGPAKKQLAVWLEELQRTQRAAQVQLAKETRWIATEDLVRLRDALGVVPPPGISQMLMQAVDDPLGDLVSRYARTHAPFRASEVAARFGI